MCLQKHQFAVVNIRCPHEHRWHEAAAITRLMVFDTSSFRWHTPGRRSFRFIVVVIVVAVAGGTVRSGFRCALSWLWCRCLLRLLVLGDERCNQLRTFKILCRLLEVQAIEEELQTTTSRLYPCIFTVGKALPFEQIFNEKDHARPP